MPLHVRAHQRAVRIVVLKERNQRRSYGYKLLRAHVDVVHIAARHQHKVPLPARIHQVLGDHALFVELDVRLRNGVLVFFPSREVEAERNLIDPPLARLLQPAFSRAASSFSM